jgi:short-subunit dehydrogenase
VIRTVDVAQPELAMPLVRELIEELGDVELFIVSAGTGFDSAALAWELERDTIAVNVLGSRPWSMSRWRTWRHEGRVISSGSHPWLR